MHLPVKNQQNLNNELSEADWCQAPGGEVMTAGSVMVVSAAFTPPDTVFNCESDKQKRSHSNSLAAESTRCPKIVCFHSRSLQMGKSRVLKVLVFMTHDSFVIYWLSWLAG